MIHLTAFTMDAYSHIIKEMAKDAMKLLDEVIPKGNLKSINANSTLIVDNK